MTMLPNQGIFQIYPRLHLDGSTKLFFTPLASLSLLGPSLGSGSCFFKISTGGSLIGGPFIFDDRVEPCEPLSCYFSYKEESKKLLFKDDCLLRIEVYNQMKELAGLGIFLMSSLVESPSNSYSETPLIKSSSFVSIPILNAQTVELVGQASFSYLLVLPFVQDLKAPTSNIASHWRPPSNKIIGHRGFGANRNVHLPQVRENTILSFNAATLLGAGWIEFDVQVTKELVPVIYHDYLIDSVGHHAPVSSFLCKDFSQLKSSQVLPWTNPRARAPHYRSRSSPGLLAPGANLLGSTSALNIIHENLSSLEQAFKKIKSDVGFNIEIKYPSLEERRVFQLDFVHEINIYCDVVLACVYANVDDRPIVFSSFHPNVCICLCFKQATFPVMFLSEAGSRHHMDARCASIQGAIQFAKRSCLFGIVLESEPLIKDPSLILTVKRARLALFTYGSKNNIIENVKLQIDMGVDGIIVDRVGYIVKNTL